MKPAGGLSHLDVEAGHTGDAGCESTLQTVPCRSTGESLTIRLGLVGALLGLLTFPTFQDLWTVWSTRPDASHGFLIPLIAATLVRQRWLALRRLPCRPSLGPGIPLVTLSLAGLLLGNAGSVVTLSGLSFIGLAAGLVLTLFGKDWFRLLAFPLGYLLFMVPVLDSVTEPLQPYFQLITARMAKAMLAQFSLPVFQAGTMLHLPTGDVQVAAECSGVGILISILAIGLPLAMMGLRTWPIRAALIFATLILSIGANWLRVALIALSGHLWGWNADLHGPLHMLHAMSVYWIGLALLLCGVWVGRSIEGRTFRHTPKMTTPRPAPSWALPCSPGWTHVWAMTCMIMSVALMLLSVSRAIGSTSSPHLSQLPETIGDWTWDRSEPDRPPITVDPVDQHITQTYRNGSGERVQLSVAYLASQSQGRELINHRTLLLHQQASSIGLGTGDAAVTVNHTPWGESHQRQELIFWYHAGGRVVADRRYAKLMTAVSSLSGRGSGGALILISRPLVSSHDATPPIDDPLARFTLQALPVLQAHLS
ncbi:MAG: exosortase W [Nitrospira sp.]|nr:exosortase W [Nitrospira sp.]